MLSSAIRAGAASRDFFGTAYGEGGGKYDGFQFGAGDVSVDDTLLLIEPETAKQYAIDVKNLIEVIPPEGEESEPAPPPVDDSTNPIKPPPIIPPKSFHGTADVPAATAKMRLVKIADEIVALLASDPNASIRVTVEIEASFPGGASEPIRRGVSENAASLGFKTKDWE